MRSLLFLTLVTTLIQSVLSQPAIDLCAGCTIINGAGYNSHPTDCDKFVQCHYDGAGNLVGEIMQCAFSTFWDMDDLTCQPVSLTNCLNDPCRDQLDDTVYGAESNCRGYWRCDGGRSVAECCPGGQRHNDVIDNCVDDVDDVCKDSCFNATSVDEICNRRPVQDRPDLYEEEVAGWGFIQRPCPLGTHFWPPSCQCNEIVDHVPLKKMTCRPEVFLPFSEDHRDASGKNNYVGNVDVDVRDGVAVFNGVTSRLIIPRFTNLEHSETVVIKAKYRSDHSVSGLARALVSNSDCGNLPSILVAEDNTNVYFGVGTSGKRFGFTFVPHKLGNPTQPSSKEFLYKFDAGMLTGSNGATESTTEADGVLRNVRCALQIGHADNLNPLKGEVDELTVYLCNPDN